MKKKQAAEKPDRHKKKGKTKPGLTFVERRRLAELKHMLAGTNKNAEKPTTAQKTITFQKMYRDGICQVTSGFYTKMVEFYDINYDLLEIEDKGEILEEYSRLINYFDPSIKFELFLFNRQVNEQTLIDQFDIPLQADDFDDIREEYTQMLKKQAAKGNNGIIKSKYLIFGIESKGFKEARAKLVSIEADVIKNLTNLGTHAKSLDGKERLRILHEYFNQDTMEPFRFSFKELAESGKSVKDYIAPPGFDFRYPSRFKAGKMYGSVHYLDIIAPKFDDELLKKLLDLDANLTITMHMQTMDAGFKMAVSFDSFNHKFVMNIKGQLSHNLEIGVDPLGNISRINHALEAMTKELAEASTKLENVERQLETAKVEVTKPFAQEAELSEKLDRLSALNALLNMDEKGDDGIGMEDDKSELGTEQVADTRKPYPIENTRHNYAVENGNPQGMRLTAAMADKPAQRVSLKEKLETMKVKAAGNNIENSVQRDKGKEEYL